jgi:hypothetical protein
MKIHQLSTFLENQAGKLKLPCHALAEAGVDIRTLTLADTQQFGILRLIVDDWQKGKAALERAGLIVNVAEVVAVEVPDSPGGLDSVLDVIDESGTNVEYMYAFTFGRTDKAVLIFRFEDTDVAIDALQRHGINLVNVFGER